MRVLFFLLAFLATAHSYDVPELTMENFDEMTDGKTVFLFFYAPWVSVANPCEMMLTSGISTSCDYFSGSTLPVFFASS
jgi:hypothetical protein